MMTLNKIKHFLCIALFAVMLGGCSEASKELNEPKESNESNEPRELSDTKLLEEAAKIEELLSRAGKLQTIEEDYETSTVIDSVVSDPITITDTNGKPSRTQTTKITRQISAANNPSEFATLSPWDMLWPGSLIQGGSLRDGVPSNIPIYNKRKLGRILLPIASGNNKPFYKETEMRPSNVTQAVNELIKEHLTSQPAQTAMKFEIVSSVEQMAFSLGLNVDLFGASLKTTFGSGWSKNKSYVAVKLDQIFFRVDYEHPDGGFSGVFTDDITAKDLENYTGSGNPICYVSSIAYGRSYIALYESSEAADSLRISLSAAYSKYSGSADMDRRKVVNEARCTLLQLGGDPKAGLESVFGNFDAVQKFVEEGAIASPTNIGAPISFTIRHLKDNSLAKLTNTLEYKVTEHQVKTLDNNNDVVIDILNARFEEPKPIKENKKVSNQTIVRLNKISIIHGEEGGEMIVKDIKIPTGNHQAHLGVDIPIHQLVKISKVPKNHRIRIKSEVFVHNHTWGYGRWDGHKTITRSNDFIFDADKNCWVVITSHPSSAGEGFKSLACRNETVGPAKTNFKINIRFRCDGEIYPISY